MTALQPYPDAELVFLDLLNAIAPSVTRTDENLVAPAVQVQRVGGADDGVTDRPRIQVTCYGTTRAEAWSLSEQARQVILAAAGTEVSGEFVQNVFIDSTRTMTPGQQLPEINPNLQTVTAYYGASFRRPWST